MSVSILSKLSIRFSMSLKSAFFVFCCSLVLHVQCCGIAGHVFHDNSTYVTCTVLALFHVLMYMFQYHLTVMRNAFECTQCNLLITLQFHTNLISGVRLANFLGQLGRSTLYLYSSSIRF